MNSGIYKITNIITNDFYIGSSCNLNIRKRVHFSQLTKNIHNNKHLQNSFNKNGIINFNFEVLAYAPPEYLLKLEQWFIDNLRPMYNNLQFAGNSLNYRHSEESIIKLKSQNKFYCSKKLYQYSLNGNYITKWNSCSEYAKYYKISRVAVIKAVKRNHKCKGYIVSYNPPTL